MTTAEDIVARARACLGVRWVHGGRSPEHGLDCGGLLLHAGAGLVDAAAVEREIARPGYSRIPDGKTLRAVLHRHLDPVAVPAPGDVLLLCVRRPRLADPVDQHLAIRTADGMVHAVADTGIARVVEHAFAEPWVSRLTGAYRFRGLAGGGE